MQASTRLGEGAVSGRKYGRVEPVYATQAALAALTTPRLPDRPARVQVEQKRALQQTEHLGDYNIWYAALRPASLFSRARFFSDAPYRSLARSQVRQVHGRALA